MAHYWGCKPRRPVGNEESLCSRMDSCSHWEESNADLSRSPGANLGRSGCATETPSSSAYDLWDDHTDNLIYQAGTPDLWNFYGSPPPASESEHTASNQDTSKAANPWNTKSSWHKGWIHNDSWTTHASQNVPSPTPWQDSAKVDNFQIHDPWRTARANNVHDSHSWQPGVGNEEPSLLSPRPPCPCPERCFEPLLEDMNGTHSKCNTRMPGFVLCCHHLPV